MPAHDAAEMRASTRALAGTGDTSEAATIKDLAKHEAKSYLVGGRALRSRTPGLGCRIGVAAQADVKR
jgi:hypothetical protein